MRATILVLGFAVAALSGCDLERGPSSDAPASPAATPAETPAAPTDADSAAPTAPTPANGATDETSFRWPWSEAPAAVPVAFRGQPAPGCVPYQLQPTRPQPAEARVALRITDDGIVIPGVLTINEDGIDIQGRLRITERGGIDIPGVLRANDDGVVIYAGPSSDPSPAPAPVPRRETLRTF
jgi:hypothetical protein